MFDRVISQTLDHPLLAMSSQSWMDPQIFLETTAQDKSAPTHYDITDFISGTIEEELIVG